MIIGIGNDLVDIRRVQDILKRHGKRFIDRCYTQSEREQAAKKTDQAAFYAKRFAVKEALLKALGTGFANGISWQDMSVSNDEKGKPLAHFSGQAANHLSHLMPLGHVPQVHVSISDDFPYAQAFVVIEALERADET